MDSETLKNLKTMIREDQVNFFTNDELEFYFNKNNGDLDKTAYQCLIIKSEDTTLQIAGMTAEDSSKYYRRLASMYKPNNSGILKG